MTALIAVVGIVESVAYLWHFKRVAVHTPYSESLRHPLHAVEYILAYLGHPAQPLGVARPRFSACSGCSASAAWRRLARRPSGATHGIALLDRRRRLRHPDRGPDDARPARLRDGASAGEPVRDRGGDVLDRAGSRRLAVRRLASRSRSAGHDPGPDGAGVRCRMLAVALCAGLAGGRPGRRCFRPGLSRSSSSQATPAASATGRCCRTCSPRRRRSPISPGSNASSSGRGRTRTSGASRAGRTRSRFRGLPACHGHVDGTTRCRAPSASRAGWPHRGGEPRRLHRGRRRGGREHGAGYLGFFRPDVKAAGAGCVDYSGFIAFGPLPTRPAERVVMLTGDGAHPCARSTSSA